MISGIEPGKMSFSVLDPNSNITINASPSDTADIEIVDGVPTVKKKRGRPRKADKEEAAIAKIVDTKDLQESTLPATIMSSTDPIIDRYKQSTDMLHHTVMQFDTLASELKQDLNQVRAMRNTTAKYKYEAIGTIGGTMSNLLRNKIEAIKEINKTITDTNKMEISKYKEIGDLNAKKSDDERIMDMYNAFVNMPVGSYNPSLGFPTTIDATTGAVSSYPMGMASVTPQNITPEMNRVLMGDNPNIQTVVVSDPTTGQYAFDVIDKSTGQSVPNYPRPGQMVLEDLQLNPREGVAVNKNLGIEYPLMERPSMPMVVPSHPLTLREVDPVAAQAYEDLGEIGKKQF
jgi:hypothetical protein